MVGTFEASDVREVRQVTVRSSHDRPEEINVLLAQDWVLLHVTSAGEGLTLFVLGSPEATYDAVAAQEERVAAEGAQRESVQKMFSKKRGEEG